jgi:uracil-DNA glycosylase
MERWAKQGVLLLNTALTVEEGASGSHLELWKEFTTEVLKALNDGFGTIFLLWGNDAKKFKPLINEKAHYVLEAKHPVSAVYAGVGWECNHFLEVNRILQTLNGDSIEWLELPPGITPNNEIQGLSD